VPPARREFRGMKTRLRESRRLSVQLPAPPRPAHIGVESSLRFEAGRNTRRYARFQHAEAQHESSIGREDESPR
jgi:hypothetical protein